VKLSGPSQRLALVLLAVILFPALFFSGYQIFSLTKSENMLLDLYQRQTESILFAVNQYSLDAVQSWIGAPGALDSAAGGDAGVRDRFRAHCDHTPALLGVWTADSAGSSVRYVAAKSRFASPPVPEASIASALEENRSRLARLHEYLNSRYRKIEPMYPAGGDSSSILLFVFPAGTERAPRIAGFAVDRLDFIRTVINARLEDAAVAGILREGDAAPVLRSASATAAGLIGEKSLWLLPGYSIGVQMAGEPLETTISSRFTVNVVLIVLLDLMLLAGAFVLYRNVRREMDLAAMKAGFVSNVSHELRTPLALIRMYAETLEMGRAGGPEKQREYIAVILRESERLTRLVGSVLNFSRMETGRREFHFGVLDLNASARAVLDTFALELQQKGCVTVFEPAAGLPDIRADREAVFEAIMNLVENAVKYGGTKPYLRVATRAAEREVCLEVEDHGIGVGAEHHGRIFEMFYRVDGGAAGGAKGTGIGLALVRHIMEAHGGSATVRSVPGAGSTFTLAFPRPAAITGATAGESDVQDPDH
jgi:two-component system, OmpR family, phosphate regulon sensor histidine kinase PhoR